MEQTGQETLAAYRRAYSELAGLQQAEEVTYQLGRTADEFCFCAGRQASPQAVCCRCRGLEEGFARRVLQYLYENAVAPEQLPDVLRDLCGCTA